MQLSNMFLAAINYTLHKQLFILWAACSTFHTESLSKMSSTEKIIESHFVHCILYKLVGQASNIVNLSIKQLGVGLK